MIQKLYLTPAEVAQVLNVHAETIRVAIKKGHLKAIKLSDSKKSRWRIHKDEVNNFLYQKTLNGVV